MALRTLNPTRRLLSHNSHAGVPALAGLFHSSPAPLDRSSGCGIPIAGSDRLPPEQLWSHPKDQRKWNNLLRPRNYETYSFLPKVTGKSRVQSWGPTVADKKITVNFQSEEGISYTGWVRCDGETSLLHAAIVAGHPNMRRRCSMPGTIGEARCGMCHVILPKRLYDQTTFPIQEEWTTLNMLRGYDLGGATSRLACQIPAEKYLDGANVFVPIYQNWFHDNNPTKKTTNLPFWRDSYYKSKSMRIAHHEEYQTNYGNTRRENITDNNRIPTYMDCFWVNSVDEIIDMKREGRRILPPPAPDYKFGMPSEQIGGQRVFKNWVPFF